MLEFVIIVLPILSVCTVLHERTYLYLCSLLVVILLHGFNKLYFLVDTFMSSVPFDDETKKNTSLILTVGSAESDRKGYITMFRGIVVLYTLVFSLSLFHVGSSAFSLWISPSSHVNTPKLICKAIRW